MPKKIKIVEMYKKYLFMAYRKKEIYKGLAKKKIITKDVKAREF